MSLPVLFSVFYFIFKREEIIIHPAPYVPPKFSWNIRSLSICEVATCLSFFDAKRMLVIRRISQYCLHLQSISRRWEENFFFRGKMISSEIELRSPAPSLFRAEIFREDGNEIIILAMQLFT